MRRTDTSQSYSAPARKWAGFVMPAVLLAGVALLILLGSAAYRSVLQSRDASSRLRGTLSYVRTQVKAHDRTGCVELRNGGSVLVLKEQAEDGEYELRIFAENGMLTEEYLEVTAGKPAAARAAGSRKKLTNAEKFTARLAENGLLCVNIDGNFLYIKLFAAEGGQDL